MKNHRSLLPQLLLSSLLLLGLLASCQKQETAVPECCSEELASSPLPETSLYQLTTTWTNQDGESLQLPALRGKVYALAMIFTHCEYACPLILADLKNLEQSLQEQDAHFLLVSMDPDRDSPEVLKDYAQRNGLSPTRWTLLRSDATAVRELAAVLGVNYKRSPTGDFAHSSIISILNPQGEVAFQQKGLGTAKDPTLDAIRAAIQ